jgi:hypothetical protein
VSVTVTSGNIPVSVKFPVAVEFPVEVEPAVVNGTGPRATVTVNAPANGTVSVIGTLPETWWVPAAAATAAVSITGVAATTVLWRLAGGPGGPGVLVTKFTESTGRVMAPISPTTAAALRKQRTDLQKQRTEPRTPSVYGMPGNGKA